MDVQVIRAGAHDLAVRTWGDPAAEPVLITTWYSGTHEAWQPYIGSGHALDPERYFLVCVNQLGNGVVPLPGSPDLTIADDVIAQERLLREHFGIEQLALVVGASMGAMQAYEWGVRFPGRVQRIAAIAGTARTTARNRIVTRMLDEQLTGPGGLRRQSHLWAALGYSTPFWEADDGAALGALEDVFETLDPAALLTQSRKWRQADAGDLSGITARTFVMPIDHDLLFPPADCAAEQAVIPGSELRVLESVHGHLALFALDPGFAPQVDAHLSELLSVG